MNVAIKPLFQFVLTGSLAEIYAAPTSPPNAQAIVKALWIVNITAGAIDVTIRWGAGTLTSANALMEARPFAAHEDWFRGASDSMVLIVPAGYHLQGLASSAASIVITGFGDVIT